MVVVASVDGRHLTVLHHIIQLNHIIGHGQESLQEPRLGGTIQRRFVSIVSLPRRREVLISGVNYEIV